MKLKVLVITTPIVVSQWHNFDNVEVISLNMIPSKKYSNVLVDSAVLPNIDYYQCEKIKSVPCRKRIVLTDMLNPFNNTFQVYKIICALVSNATCETIDRMQVSFPSMVSSIISHTTVEFRSENLKTVEPSTLKFQGKESSPAFLNTSQLNTKNRRIVYDVNMEVLPYQYEGSDKEFRHKQIKKINKETCAICLSEKCDSILNCGHIFCQTCVETHYTHFIHVIRLYFRFF